MTLTENDKKTIALADAYADDPIPFPGASLLLLVSKLAKENERLFLRDIELQFLEEWGVDNWTGFDEAGPAFYKWKVENGYD